MASSSKVFLFWTATMRTIPTLWLDSLQERSYRPQKCLFFSRNKTEVHQGVQMPCQLVSWLVTLSQDRAHKTSQWSIYLRTRTIRISTVSLAWSPAWRTNSSRRGGVRIPIPPRTIPNMRVEGWTNSLKRMVQRVQARGSRTFRINRVRYRRNRSRGWFSWRLKIMEWSFEPMSMQFQDPRAKVPAKEVAHHLLLEAPLYLLKTRSAPWSTLMAETWRVAMRLGLDPALRAIRVGRTREVFKRKTFHLFEAR